MTTRLSMVHGKVEKDPNALYFKGRGVDTVAESEKFMLDVPELMAGISFPQVSYQSMIQPENGPRKYTEKELNAILKGTHNLKMTTEKNRKPDVNNYIASHTQPITAVDREVYLKKRQMAKSNIAPDEINHEKFFPNTEALFTILFDDINELNEINGNIDTEVKKFSFIPIGFYTDFDAGIMTKHQSWFKFDDIKELKTEHHFDYIRVTNRDEIALSFIDQIKEKYNGILPSTFSFSINGEEIQWTSKRFISIIIESVVSTYQNMAAFHYDIKTETNKVYLRYTAITE